MNLLSILCEINKGRTIFSYPRDFIHSFIRVLSEFYCKDLSNKITYNTNNINTFHATSEIVLLSYKGIQSFLHINCNLQQHYFSDGIQRLDKPHKIPNFLNSELKIKKVLDMQH